MNTFIYGTGNPAKLAHMRNMIASLDVEVVGLNDVGIAIPEVDESGNDPLENARIKALSYYEATGMPVFSCDSGLYIKGAPDELQPGVHVRNIGGKYLSDDEMIEHYGALSARLGDNVKVQYRNAICLVMSENEIYEYTGDDIAGDMFILTSKPHPKRTPGFPIDSLSVHIETGKYYYDMDELKDRSSMDEGFRSFFARVLKSEE